jgi:integration host factor subunit beta
VVTKADIINVISDKCNITRVKAEVVVETLFNSIKETLKNGNRVEIRNFGIFEVRHYDAYKGRNPKTGEILKVLPKRLPFFKVAKNLKENMAAKDSSP